jgi:hypothetical protein
MEKGKEQKSIIKLYFSNLGIWLQSIPLFIWIVLAFLAAYGAFFLVPIFFNSQNIMQFPQYLPSKDIIALDMRSMLTYFDSWLFQHRSPYYDGFIYYPPFATLFFLPLLLMSFKSAYIFLSSVSILIFIFSAFFIPFRLFNKQIESQSFVLLIFVSALFSYGLQFEIERGQFNLIAFAFAFIGILLFHFKPGFRILAYVFLSIAIQLKVYPAIFLFLFIDDWAQWKKTIKEFIILGLVNGLCLLILGWDIFVDFVLSITTKISDPQVWVGNHSARSFVTYFIEEILERDSYQRFWGIAQYQELMIWVLMGIIILLLIATLIHLFLSKSKGFDSGLFLILTTCALIIPSVSHDYTLPLLSVAIIFFIGEELKQDADNISGIRKLLLSIAVFFYASTLFSYTNKPICLQNNFPAIFIILLITTCLVISKRKIIKQKQISS